MFTQIDEALDWIMSRRSNNYSFEHFKQVTHDFGDPQNDLYVIHVGGTDGKGSTVNYLCELFMSQVSKSEHLLRRTMRRILIGSDSTVKTSPMKLFWISSIKTMISLWITSFRCLRWTT